MRWYLSGPMSGLPAFNFPAFDDAAAALRASGLTVLSAHEIPHDEPNGVGSLPWEQYMRDDLIDLLRDCHGIVLLPGWPQSCGARLELTLAMSLGFRVAFYQPEQRTLIDMTDAAVAAIK